MQTITTQQLKKLSHKKQVMFALFCAKQVQHLTNAPEVHKCIEIVELWLEGGASKAQCHAVAHAAANIAHGTANHARANASYAAANAAYAIDAAHAAAAAAYANAAANAAAYATYTAAYAASAHASAANDKQAVIAEQERYYSELLHFDELIDSILLG